MAYKSGDWGYLISYDLVDEDNNPLPDLHYAEHIYVVITTPDGTTEHECVLINPATVEYKVEKDLIKTKGKIEIDVRIEYPDKVQSLIERERDIIV